MKRVNLVLQDGVTIPCEIYDNYTANWWYKQSKHFQHLEVLNHPLYNPYSYEGIPFYLSEVKKYSDKFSLNIDTERNIDQKWCNYAHQIYEVNCAKYCRDTDLQIMHRSIHQIEHLLKRKNKPHNHIYIDYFSKGGFLSRKITTEDQKLKKHLHKKGTILITWAELGKTPRSYFEDNEPNIQTRVNELVKPFSNMYVNATIMLEDGCRWDADNQEMIEWWKTYESEWMKHWNLTEYDHSDYTGTICIGKVMDVDLLEKQYQRNNTVKYIKRV